MGERQAYSLASAPQPEPKPLSAKIKNPVSLLVRIGTGLAYTVSVMSIYTEMYQLLKDLHNQDSGCGTYNRTEVDKMISEVLNKCPVAPDGEPVDLQVMVYVRRGQVEYIRGSVPIGIDLRDCDNIEGGDPDEFEEFLAPGENPGGFITNEDWARAGYPVGLYSR